MRRQRTRAQTAVLAPVLMAGLLLAGCTSDRGDDPPATGATEPGATSDRAESAGADDSRPEGARLDQVRRAAVHAVEVVLSYDHRTLDADEQAAWSLMTEEYAEEFRASFSGVREEATRVQGSSRAVAIDSGVVSATADSVRVLVFVDRTLRSTAAQPSVSQIAPVVSMQRSGDAWRLADITTGTPSGSGAPTGREVAVVRHATQTARAYLALDWETIEQDLAGAQDLVAGELAQQYAEGADELVEAVRARRTLQEPRILAVGLSAVGARQADALVSAVVTTTHQATGGEPSQEGRRLRLRLERDGEDWRTTRLAVVD